MQNKECFNRCPKCNSDNIEWGDKEWQDSSASQKATCNVCSCEFEEVYEYNFTEWNGTVQVYVVKKTFKHPSLTVDNEDDNVEVFTTEELARDYITEERNRYYGKIKLETEEEQDENHAMITYCLDIDHNEVSMDETEFENPMSIVVENTYDGFTVTFDIEEKPLN